MQFGIHLFKTKYYLCVVIQKQLIIKYKIMNADIFTDADVLSVFNKTLNQSSIEEIEAKRTHRRRVAKADFFNLKEVTDREKFMNL